MSYRDGFEVVEKVVRGFILKCKRCGENVRSHWGMAKKHAAKHEAAPPSTTDTATTFTQEPTREPSVE